MEWWSIGFFWFFTTPLLQFSITPACPEFTQPRAARLCHGGAPGLNGFAGYRTKRSLLNRSCARLKENWEPPFFINNFALHTPAPATFKLIHPKKGHFRPSKISVREEENEDHSQQLSTNFDLVVDFMGGRLPRP
jgi:hypothetical protein